MNISFFVNTNIKNFEIIEFYNQDIIFLKELGYEVHLATKWTEIDWHSDLIFIWWWTYAFFPVFMAKILGKKTIITGTFNFRCPNFDLEYFQRNLIQRKLIKYATFNANANILVSKNEINAMQQEWGLNNLYYSPHTVDIEKYSPLKNNAARENFLFTLCGMTPRILKRKCIPELLQSILRVKQHYPDIKLLIAGRDGPGKTWLENMIMELGLQENVEYLGEVSKKKKIELMQSCAIYVQPSIYEGFGLAIAEAMSCGAPVISTAVGAVPEVVGDGGLLIKECNPDLLEESIIDLLNSPDTRKKIGEKARERIVQNFYPERRMNDLYRIIQSI